MCSASERLPENSTLLPAGSPAARRTPGRPRGGAWAPVPCEALALLLLRAVAAPSLLAVADALGVQRPANDLVADAGEVLHSATAHEHDRVLLQVVTDARDVGGDLDLAGQPHARDLAQRRVRLLRRGRVHPGADATPLGRALEGRRLRLVDLVLPALADQLLDRRHAACNLPRVRQRCVMACGGWVWWEVPRTRPFPIPLLWCCCEPRIPGLSAGSPIPAVGRVAPLAGQPDEVVVLLW